MLLVASPVFTSPTRCCCCGTTRSARSVPEVILAYVGYNACNALSSYPRGLLADRIRGPAVFGIGLVFFAIGYADSG